MEQSKGNSRSGFVFVVMSSLPAAEDNELSLMAGVLSGVFGQQVVNKG